MIHTLSFAICFFVVVFGVCFIISSIILRGWCLLVIVFFWVKSIKSNCLICELCLFLFSPLTFEDYKIIQCSGQYNLFDEFTFRYLFGLDHQSKIHLRYVSNWSDVSPWSVIFWVQHFSHPIVGFFFLYFFPSLKNKFYIVLFLDG